MIQLMNGIIRAARQKPAYLPVRSPTLARVSKTFRSRQAVFAKQRGRAERRERWGGGCWQMRDVVAVALSTL